MSLESIGFANIIGSRQNLKIPGHMQSTDYGTLQRHDVINFMMNAGLACESLRTAVNVLDGRLIYPNRCRLEFGPESSKVVLAQMLNIGRSPFRKIRLLVCSVFSIPLCMMIRIGETIFFRSGIGAWDTGIRQTIWRLFAQRKIAMGFRCLTDVAALHLRRAHGCACCAFGCERWIPQSRCAAFAIGPDTESTVRPSAESIRLSLLT